MSHTKGPWVISAKTGSGYAGLIKSAEGIEIAQMLSNRGSTGGSNCDPDASLVAAAPELLEALKNVLSHMQEGMWWGSDFLAMRAAIDKAEGK